MKRCIWTQNYYKSVFYIKHVDNVSLIYIEGHQNRRQHFLFLKRPLSHQYSILCFYNLLIPSEPLYPNIKSKLSLSHSTITYWNFIYACSITSISLVSILNSTLAPWSLMLMFIFKNSLSYTCGFLALLGGLTSTTWLLLAGRFNTSLLLSASVCPPPMFLCLRYH